MLTAEYLRARLDYNAETGVFTWRAKLVEKPQDRAWNNRFAGRSAGSVGKNGYVYVCLDRKSRLAHRLAWVYVTGEDAPPLVDHKDRNPLNNSFSNLRRASPSQNQANRKRRKDNRSSVKGVMWDRKEKQWRAEIRVERKSEFIGYFDSSQQAAEAYALTAYLRFGDFVDSETWYWFPFK